MVSSYHWSSDTFHIDSSQRPVIPSRDHARLWVWTGDSGMVCEHKKIYINILPSLYARNVVCTYWFRVYLFRAANQLWQDSLFEIQTVDTSSEMGDMARRLRAGGDLEEEQGGEGGGGGGGWGGGGGEGRLCEAIPGVYFRQYLPTSNKVRYCPLCMCIN